MISRVLKWHPVSLTFEHNHPPFECEYDEISFPWLCYEIGQRDNPEWAWPNQESPFKVACFPQLVTEERDVTWLTWKKANIFHAVNWKRSHRAQSARHTLKARSGQWLKTSRKLGTAILQPQKKISSFNNWRACKRILSLRWEPQPCPMPWFRPRET